MWCSRSRHPSSFPRLAPWLLGALLPLPVAAADSLDGEWVAGPLRETFTIQGWQAACGPTPRNTAAGEGQAASVREQDGLLSIRTATRSYRSDRCYDTMSTLEPEPVVYDAAQRSWRLRCATPAADPRKAMMQTLVSTSSARIDITETGRYEIRVQSGRCVADVHRSQSFTRAATGLPGDAGAAAPPDAAARDAGACAEPGPVHRIEPKPARQVVQAGERLKVRVDAYDARGCALELTPQVRADAPLRVETSRSTGQLTIDVPADAHEGSLVVRLGAGTVEAKVSVEVVSSARYAQLVASGELQAPPDDEESVPSDAGAQTLDERVVVAESAGEQRRLIFVVLVAALLMGLGVAALLLRKRGARRSGQSSASSPRPPSAAAEPASPTRRSFADTPTEMPVFVSERRACPVCAREYEPPTQFCPHDGAQLADPREQQGGAMCPVCGRGFDRKLKVCPEHGEELVPPGTLRAQSSQASGGKICPMCGHRFDGKTVYCSRDGSVLVTVN